MIDIVKIIFGFLFFFYIIRLITQRYFPIIEGMCMDGEDELPNISETECSNAGFTWNESSGDIDDIDDIDDTLVQPSINTSDIPEPIQILNRAPNVETDEERNKRIKRESSKSSSSRNLVTGAILSSSCCSYCCSCLFCLAIFLPLLPRR